MASLQVVDAFTSLSSQSVHDDDDDDDYDDSNEDQSRRLLRRAAVAAPHAGDTFCLLSR